MTYPSAWFLCQVFTAYFGGHPIISSSLPRGTCLTHCCQITEHNDIKFFLYTNQNPNSPYRLYLDDEDKVERSNLDLANPLVVFIHGFGEAYSTDNLNSQQIKNAFLKAGKYNVILVDWSPLSASPWYIDAVQNVPKAGFYIARFLNFLVNLGFPKEQIHVIGFSLGAEVAGYAGNKLRDWNVKLQRITGLDPPHCSTNELSPIAAEFVDIIHTDAGFMGSAKQMGHADFYPNDGKGLQRGCIEQELAHNIDQVTTSVRVVGCSHQRAWQYFVESVAYAKSFPSERSENCYTCNDVEAFMGMGADKRLRGKFYLTTRDKFPFGKNSP